MNYDQFQSHYNSSLLQNNVIFTSPLKSKMDNTSISFSCNPVVPGLFYTVPSHRISLSEQLLFHG
jgi:hypothetical protein